MHDEATFHQAMQEHPEDTRLRLVFADWLEERGDQRGELLRLMHTLTLGVEIIDRRKLEDRLRSLLAAGVQPVGPFFTNSISMRFAWIPAGTFLMGSPAKEKGRKDNETQRRVTLTKGFYLAIYPVTQASWRKAKSKNPSNFRGDDLPAEQVSWYQCREYLRSLSKKDGHSYRLPTEAEWEYACRGGTSTPFSFGESISTDQANYNGHYPYGKGAKGEYRGQTTPVGSFPPNAWGLYDMHGNVWEWCQDWYREYPKVVDPQWPANRECRVLRGGSFDDYASYVRSGNRIWGMPTDRNYALGFRAVMIVRQPRKRTALSPR